MLALLRDREQQGQIEADAALDAWMQARAAEGMHGSVASELVLHLLGLEVSNVYEGYQCICIVNCLLPKRSCLWHSRGASRLANLLHERQHAGRHCPQDSGS